MIVPIACRGEDLSLVDQVVRDFQKSHLGIAADSPDIGFDYRAGRLLGVSPVAADKESGNSRRSRPAA
jgi:hypothetical protein